MRRYSAFESVLENTDPQRAFSASTAGTHASYATDSPSTDDDELPTYEDIADDRLGTVPSYEEDRLLTPAQTFNLLCLSSKAQIFIDTLSGANPVLEEQTQTSFTHVIIQRSKPFSKKVHISLYSQPQLTTTERDTSRSMKACEVSNDPPDMSVTIDSGTILPWMPRASLRFPKKLVFAPDNPGIVNMAAPNQKDWQVKCGDRVLIWALAVRPTSLLLVDREREVQVARFVYSQYGVEARKGQAVGVLEVYSDHGVSDSDVASSHGRDSDDRTRNLLPVILASCVTVIRYWKDMGRRHRNASGAAVSTPQSLSGRSGSMSIGQQRAPLLFGTRTHAEIARQNPVAV